MSTSRRRFVPKSLRRSTENTLPRSTWAFLTRSRVTWRESLEGSSVVGLSLLGGAIMLAGSLIVRRARRSGEQ